MAVIMVAGNVVQMPSILGTVRLMTTGIVIEMSYSSGLHRQALFAIGLVLFVFIMIVNIAFTYISRKECRWAMTKSLYQKNAVLGPFTENRHQRCGAAGCNRAGSIIAIS